MLFSCCVTNRNCARGIEKETIANIAKLSIKEVEEIIEQAF